MDRRVEFMEFFKLAIFFFVSIGIEPFDVEDKDSPRSLHSCLIFAVNFFNLNMCGMFMFSYILVSLKRGENFVQAVMTGSYVGYVFISVTKICYICSKRKQLSRLMNRLKQLYPRTYGEQLDYSLPRYLKQCTRISIVFSVIDMLLIWTYNLFAAVQYLVADRWLGVREVGKQLSYFMWIPWDYEGHWSYYAIYGASCLAGYTATAGQLAMDLLLFSTATQIIMHYEYLARTIEGYVVKGGHAEGANAKKSDEDIQFLGSMVEYHEKVLSLSKLMNDVFGVPLLLNFMASSLIICFLGFQMTIGVSTDMIIKLFIFLFASMVQVFLICYYGEELSEVSENIAQSVYNQNWYDAEVRYKKMLILIAERAQKTASLQATGFLLISRITMTDIMRISYKFFALLRTMYAE